MNLKVILDPLSSIKEATEDDPMFIKQESIYDPEKSEHRWVYPNVRGGWTLAKIERELKRVSSYKTKGTFESITRSVYDAIMEYNSFNDFVDHTFFHGTFNYIDKGLRAGFRQVSKDGSGGSGGYGEGYHSISLSKSKDTASNFTADSSYGTVHPVLLKKNSKVIEMPGIKDATDLEEHLVELWTRGIDAVYIGGGEEELTVLNPRCLLLMAGESFAVYHKARFSNPVKAMKAAWKAVHSNPRPERDSTIEIGK